VNILFVSSEVFPLVKTGGLADVSASLPLELAKQGQDVRIMLPAYQSVLAQLENPQVIAHYRHYGNDIRLLQTNLPGSDVMVMLVDCPAAFDRPGNPYVDEHGHEWADNAFRFALFCQTVVDVALNRSGIDWPIDVVHCNDWQTALVPALLSKSARRPASVFTIHNMAYQGLFPKQTFFDLGLPRGLFTPDGVEFHDLFSFIKGGLNFSEVISTVSPQYALEIQSEQFGYGLHSLLQYRNDRLRGILNGIDTEVWNPETDSTLAQTYNQNSLEQKLKNKVALLKEFGMSAIENAPLIGFIGRLVEQKGVDLILQAMPELVQLPLQMVFLGTGLIDYERALSEWAKEYPDRVAVWMGYDEGLSHRIEAGSDAFLMPSLFEPCGLNQLYSLRYGTLPIVTPVGGLADSVIDFGKQPAEANGFMLADRDSASLVSSIELMLEVYRQPSQWRQLQRRAMSEDHSWSNSASEYLTLYQTALQYRKAETPSP
jgi:starch synthase